MNFDVKKHNKDLILLYNQANNYKFSRKNDKNLINEINNEDKLRELRNYEYLFIYTLKSTK